MNEIIQLKIKLRGSEPEIWRRIQVDYDTSFFDLHHIIQITMGWQNYHLYEFRFENYRVSEPDEEMDGIYPDLQYLDPRNEVGPCLGKVGVTCEYEYDFGDGWKHDIVVEKIINADAKTKYLACIGGELRCPPEDCGGIHGFYHTLRVLADKSDPEHKEMKTWVGKNYDPEKFDIESVNRKLKSLDNYIEKWLENG
ncbi:MAG: plasmid pRiA4b ORF-3 family protein [Bacteroidota bacterium]